MRYETVWCSTCEVVGPRELFQKAEVLSTRDGRRITLWFCDQHLSHGREARREMNRRRARRRAEKAEEIK